MKVIKVSFKLRHHAPVRRSVIALLERVGIEGHRRPNDGRVVGTKSFWLRNEAQLQYILFDAHKSFLAMCKRLHPDLPGGDHARMAQLTADWRRIKQLFARRNVRLNEETQIQLEYPECWKENRKARARLAANEWRKKNPEKVARQKARAKQARANRRAEKIVA